MQSGFTGLPASGKTTIAALLKEYLDQKKTPNIILDGDEIRKTVSKDLGFSPEERKEHNRRVIEIAKLLVKNGIIAIIPLISPYEEPKNPEITLDTEKQTPQECLEKILSKLDQLKIL